MKTKLKKYVNDFAFVWQFALDDFKTKYAGSALGVLWAFFQPMITIGLYWFVFQLGFKSVPVENFPFILWLMVGLVPWFFLSEAVVNATTCLLEYSYLVKKVLFNINILPLAKILSVMLVQFVLIFFTIGCFMIWGYMPSICYLQVVLYLLYMVILALGMAYITATLFVFFKDIIQIVSIFTQVVFWMTPIVWSLNSMSEKIQTVLVFNPVYYVIKGFRDIFIYRQFSDTEPLMALYYWCFAIALLLIGIRLFNKCKDHFADVL